MGSKKMKLCNLPTLTIDELFTERRIISNHIFQHKNQDELNFLIKKLISLDNIINEKFDNV